MMTACAVSVVSLIIALFIVLLYESDSAMALGVNSKLQLPVAF
jgi:hypothetical protein